MSLTVIGNGDFGLIGTPRWIPGRLNELDALELVHQGAYNKLATFRNGLTKWAPSTIDNNMFLESFPDDGDPVLPKVTLRFIGCKGGQVGVPAVSYGNRLATASTTDGEMQLSALYQSPRATVSQISTSPSIPGAASPGAPTIIERRVNNHVPITFRLQAEVAYQVSLLNPTPEQQDVINARLAALEAPIAAAKARVVAYFNRAFIASTQTEFEATPLVPGRYWLCSSITSAVFIPI